MMNNSHHTLIVAKEDVEATLRELDSALPPIESYGMPDIRTGRRQPTKTSHFISFRDSGLDAAARDPEKAIIYPLTPNAREFLRKNIFDRESESSETPHVSRLQREYAGNGGKPFFTF